MKDFLNFKGNCMKSFCIYPEALLEAEKAANFMKTTIGVIFRDKKEFIEITQ